MSKDCQGDYGAAKQKMIERMVPASFVSMDGFLKRRLGSGEALSLYLYELKWLLDQAMPGLDATARSPLLLHQFMEGLPTVVSRQLRAAGDVKDLDTALERVRTWMTLEEGSTTVAAMVEKPREETQVQKLAHQITLLTEQVAALSVRESGVFVADNQDTLNDNAVIKVVTIAAIESIVVTLTGKLGRATVNILLDSGSSISLVRKAAIQVAENVRVIGIIENSCSPWMAPAVYVEKKSGDIRLCVDYRELNKRTKKDAYPLPLPDEVQGYMAGATVFSTLDLQSGYWQLICKRQKRQHFVQDLEWDCTSLHEYLWPDWCPQPISWTQ